MALALREMNQIECIQLLQRSRFGRLGCCRDRHPYVVPIYFAYEANMLYSFSLPGQKIGWMRENPNVCLETDVQGPGLDWSCVLASGQFQELPDDDEWHEDRLHAWSLLQKYNDWWEIGALKPMPQQLKDTPPIVFYEIIIETLTGRTVRQVIGK